MRLLGGDDNVIFENTSGPIDVQGNLSISGGSGANSVLSTDLKVGKNITITNGTNITGIDANTFRNVTAGGALTISNGAGDTDNAISRLSAGNSFIKGNLRITNGTGRDDNTLSDLSVGGSVSINNGRAVVGGIAGTLEISNVHNTASLSVIRGNLTVVDLDGNVAVQTISDTEVLGNVTIFNGSGPAVTHFDGFATVMPVLVHGNVTIMGTGGNEVTAGTLYNDTGLVVGKNFTVITGSTADTLTFNKLQVGGVTKLALGGGANTVTVDNSQFSGAFILNTGAGIDTVSLDSTPASAGLTTFQRPVFMNLGAGSDSVLIGTVTDLTQGIVVLDTFVIRHGLGNDVLLPFGQAVFPFLTSLQWVV
jgi:hypothetical protein